MPGERALLAWGLKYGDPQISREELLEGYFGDAVDEKLAKYQLRIDTASRRKLLNAAEQLGQEFIDTAERRLKSNDYRDPIGAELPTFTPPPREAQARPVRVPRRSSTLTVDVLFQRWKEAYSGKRTPSTFMSASTEFCPLKIRP